MLNDLSLNPRGDPNEPDFNPLGKSNLSVTVPRSPHQLSPRRKLSLENHLPTLIRGHTRSPSHDSLSLREFEELPVKKNKTSLTVKRKKHHEHTYNLEHTKNSVKKNRNLLLNSLDMINEFKSVIPDSPRSLQLADTIEDNLRYFCNFSYSSLETEELNAHHFHHLEQIKSLESELNTKERKIIELKNQLDQTSSCQSQHDLLNNLVGRIEALEKENKPLRKNYLKTTELERKLNRLFQLDKGDFNKSIEKFYYMTLNKLTAFVIAILGLNSGLIARAPSWKDELVSEIFIFLNILSDAVGVAGAAAFGAGGVIPLIIAPVLAGTELAFDYYRHTHKSKQFQKASTYFTGGLEEIENKNRNIAYGLAYLLQMQLRYCTSVGAETIIDNWIGGLCYSLMKGEKRSEEDISKIYIALSHVFQTKEKKQLITTHSLERNWTTTGLFHKAGIAYYCYGELRFESCFQLNKRSVSKQITKASKYGYLFFFNVEEAINYKGIIVKIFSEKHKREAVSFYWSKDNNALGPQVLFEDRLQITCPTLIPLTSPCDEGGLNASQNLFLTPRRLSIP